MSSMSRLQLNKIKINTLALNQWGKGVKAIAVNPDEIPKGYEPMVDPNGNTLMDANGKIIVVPIGEGGKTIKFTCDGGEYTAEAGMTWVQFCESEYNTDGWWVDGATLYLYEDDWGKGGESCYMLDVDASVDVIEAGRDYATAIDGWGIGM